jgi:anti-sigma B factor antagonist
MLATEYKTEELLRPLFRGGVWGDCITGMATPIRCSIRGLNVYNRATAISSRSRRRVLMPDQAVASFLTVAVDRTGDDAEIRCSGRLVAGVNDRLYLEVGPLIPSCKRILLDLTDVTQMDSTGLGTLVRLYVSAKSAGCALQLFNIGKPIRQLLGATRLLSVFEVIGNSNIRCG